MTVVCDGQYSKCCECTQSNRFGECPYKVKKRDIIQSGCRKLYELCREYSLSVKRMLWDTDENKEWRGQIKGIDDLYYDLYVNQTDKMSQRL